MAASFPTSEAGTLRVAFVGSSHVHTPDYIAVCDRTPWVEVVGIAEPDKATAHMLPPDLARFEAHDALPPHDVAVVMTDAASHDAICPPLAARRLFIEKPLAVDGERAAALADRLEAVGKDVRLGFFLHHAPALAAMGQALRAGRIGRLRHARLAFAHPGLREGWLRGWPAHLDPDRMGGGAFVDLAIHLVDTALHLVGPLQPVACQFDGGLAAEAGQAMLRGPNGELVHLWASGAAPRVMLDVALVGENGELVLDGGLAIIRSEGGTRVLFDGPMTTPADGFDAALDDFRLSHAKDDLAAAVATSRTMSVLLAKASRDEGEEP